MTREQTRIRSKSRLHLAAAVSLLAATAQAAEPVPGRSEFFLTVPGSFSVLPYTSSTTVSVTGGRGTEIASYTNFL